MTSFDLDLEDKGFPDFWRFRERFSDGMGVNSGVVEGDGEENEIFDFLRRSIARLFRGEIVLSLVRRVCNHGPLVWETNSPRRFEMAYHSFNTAELDYSAPPTSGGLCRYLFLGRTLPFGETLLDRQDMVPMISHFNDADLDYSIPSACEWPY